MLYLIWFRRFIRIRIRIRFKWISNYFYNKKIRINEFCPKCNKNVKFVSKANIYKKSDYLIILLKQRKKNKININYEKEIKIKEIENNQKRIYKLFGIELYNGDFSFYGHYISLCKNINIENNEEKVYLFNDTSRI